MPERSGRRGCGLGVLLGVAATVLALPSCSFSEVAAAPLTEAASPSATAEPVSIPAALERTVDPAGLPALQPADAPGGGMWRIEGAPALNTALVTHQQEQAARQRSVVVTPIAASPALVGLRLRTTDAHGALVDSSTWWYSLSGQRRLAPAELLSGQPLPSSLDARSISFTTDGELYAESVSDGQLVRATAASPGALSELGEVARTAALNPLNPVPPRPAPDCSVAKCLALTFDDGPSADTPALLRTLAENDARATFFISGTAVPGHEDTLRMTAAAGHQIGSHSLHHVRLSPLSRSEVTAEISAADAAIAPFATGFPPAFRPPYGDYDAEVRAVAAEQGDSIVMWNLDPLDYRTTDPALIVSRVLASARPGSVVLSHDTLPHSVQAYASIIPQLRAAGYELVTVDQLLGPGGPGQVRGGY